jgi:hypothetical protein
MTVLSLATRMQGFIIVYQSYTTRVSGITVLLYRQLLHFQTLQYQW